MQDKPIVASLTLKTLAKIGFMGAVTALMGWAAYHTGIASSLPPLIAVCTFVSVISATQLFWSHRLAAAFLGIALLISTRVMALQDMVRSSGLELIFFLIGMMIIVGALKDLGVFTWLIHSVLCKKEMTGTNFVVFLCLFSALLSSVIGVVSAIVVVLVLVFQVCDSLKVRAAPFVLMSVLAINIGSTATMLGNPVGVFISNKAGFTFSQFLTGAAPITAVALTSAVFVMLLWYRKSIADMTLRLEEHRKICLTLGPLIRIPHRRGVFVLTATVLIIAGLRHFASFFGLPADAEGVNSLIIVTPLVIAGLLMFYLPQRAHHYVEREVEWKTLLFFMLLFAIAGGLHQQGVTQNIADRLAAHTSGDPKSLVPFVLCITSLGSAFADNVIFVAAFKPVIQSLVEHSSDYSILWWALFFGACFGGNITIVGSTANIMALGLLEKRGHSTVSFLDWLKIGTLVGLVSGLVAWGMLTALHMPQPALHSVEAKELARPRPTPAAPN